MKLVSFIDPNGCRSFGIYRDNGIIDLKKTICNEFNDLKNCIANWDIRKMQKFHRKTVDYCVNEITFLPVIDNPGKIICAGMNYPDKRNEFKQKEAAPTLFIRFPDSQVAHNGRIIKPVLSNEFDYEGELAIIIGRSGREISEVDALACIAGYSCYMDGTARDWQHSWFTAGKNWPKTGGFGPYLVTTDEINNPQNLQIKTWLNGLLVQNDNTRNMVHSIRQLVAYISTFTHLEPGDIILTGSPGGVGKSRTPPLYLKVDDTIEVEIEAIGKLKNIIS